MLVCPVLYKEMWSMSLFVDLSHMHIGRQLWGSRPAFQYGVSDLFRNNGTDSLWFDVLDVA